MGSWMTLLIVAAAVTLAVAIHAATKGRFVFLFLPLLFSALYRRAVDEAWVHGGATKR